MDRIPKFNKCRALIKDVGPGKKIKLIKCRAYFFSGLKSMRLQLILYYISSSKLISSHCETHIPFPTALRKMTRTCLCSNSREGIYFCVLFYVWDTYLRKLTWLHVYISKSANSKDLFILHMFVPIWWLHLFWQYQVWKVHSCTSYIRYGTDVRVSMVMMIHNDLLTLNGPAFFWVNFSPEASEELVPNMTLLVIL